MGTKHDLVIIGANEFQLPLIRKAHDLGYTTHVFAWKCGDEGELAADRFYPISVTEKEAILEVCKSIEPCGVCSIASDVANLTVNFVRRGLGMTSNTAQCDLLTTNKFLMREALESNGIPVPGHWLVSNSALDLSIFDGEIPYPLIVKPVDRSGSRAISRVENYEQLANAIREARSQSFRGEAIVEEYIEGEEYSCETISYESKHNVLAITKKYTSGYPRYIESGHDQPSGLSAELVEKVKDAVIEGLDALGVVFGASHTEFFVTPEGEMRIVEIGARMGGDYIGSDLVKLSTGYDFLEMVIDISCGRAPRFFVHPHYSASSVRFALSDDDIRDSNPCALQSSNRIIVRRGTKSFAAGHVASNSSDRLGYEITAIL